MSVRIFWAIVIGFLVGVFLRSSFAFGWSVPLFFLLLALVVGMYALMRKEHWKTSVAVITLLVACVGGMVRTQGATMLGDPSLSDHVGRNIVMTGIVAEEPDARDTQTLVHVFSDSFVASGATTTIAAGVLAQLPAHAAVSYGDRVVLTGVLSLPEKFDTDTGRRFDYPGFLAARGIGYTLRFARLQSRGDNEGFAMQAYALRFKHSYLDGLHAVLPEPESSLAGGITVGDKRSVGAEITDDFQRDSLVHMLVLSGYNITVVASACMWMLQDLSRMMQFAGGIGAVFLFILMSGGAASAVRAGIMTFVALGARTLHRKYLPERALALAVFLMVMWNPLLLMFDPGFQLSALATLGLILFTPIFAGLLVRVPERFGMREILASTCATQLTVLPLLLYQNGMLSLVALPANVFALVPVPAAMFFSFIAAIGGMISGSAVSIVAVPAYLLLAYIIVVAHFFASIPFSAVALPTFPAWVLFAMYGALALWYAYIKRMRPAA